MQRRCVRLAGFGGLVALIWLSSAAPAYAYIDPGSTNFIIQLLLGSALGVGLAIATFWRRLRAFFGRLFGRKAPEGPGE